MRDVKHFWGVWRSEKNAGAKKLFGGGKNNFFCGWEDGERQKKLRVRIKKWWGGQVFFGKAE